MISDKFKDIIINVILNIVNLYFIYQPYFKKLKWFKFKDKL